MLAMVKLEMIHLATFNKDAIYAAHARHFPFNFSYSQQMVPMSEMLQFALQKAFNIDFMNIKNVHGVTHLDVYKRQWELAYEPLIPKNMCNGKDRAHAAIGIEPSKRP